MFVDPSLLRTGGNTSRRAGGHAQEGADHLARGPLSSGMFGEFDAAEAFHEAVSSAHTQHVANLQAHHQSLTAIGHNAHSTAAAFTNMDDGNAEEMRAVRPSSATTPRS
jgi:Protein of unknown function (DUF2563)